MLTKNMPEHRLVNGSRGVVVGYVEQDSGGEYGVPPGAILSPLVRAPPPPSLPSLSVYLPVCRARARAPLRPRPGLRPAPRATFLRPAPRRPLRATLAPRGGRFR